VVLLASALLALPALVQTGGWDEAKALLVARVHEARGENALALAALENALEELPGASEIERQLERLRRLNP